MAGRRHRSELAGARPPGQRSPVLRTIAVFAAIGLGASCGGGSDDGGESASTAPDSASADITTADIAVGDVPVGDVPPELEFLGDLARVASEPVTVTFDETAGSLELADGAVVEAPSGAFAEPTELTVVIVDLEFDRYATDAPSGTVYVLTTATDVDLGAPVVLDVPRPADSVRVVQAIDGVWQPVAVPPGSTARVPIAHFSTVPTAVVDAGARPIPAGDDPSGDAPAAFLGSCAFTLGWMFADNPDEGIDSYAVDLALSFCTRALVNRFTPRGERVELSCVGGKIGDEVDLRAAIQACLAEQDASADEPSAAATDPPAAPASEPDEPVEIGPLEWSGEMTPTNLGAPWTPDGPATVLITRQAGTDEFEIVLGAAITATGTVTGCVSTQDWTYDGTGSFISDDRIEFWGTYVNDRGGTCTDDAVDQELESGYFVEVTDTGLVGPNFEGFTFDLPGAPIRLGG